MTIDFNYDVFLSYSSCDEKIVGELAQRLTSDGLRVYCYEWEKPPEGTTNNGIAEILEQSRVFILIISKSLTQSDLSSFMSVSYMFRIPDNSERRFIPVLLDDTEMTGSISYFANIDWSSKSDEEYIRLLAFCRPVKVSEKHTIYTYDQIHSSKFVTLNNNVWSPCVAMAADGRTALFCSLDGAISVWDLEKDKVVKTLREHTGRICSLAVTGTGERAVSGSHDGTVRVWDIQKGTSIATFICPETYDQHMGSRKSKVPAIAITSDGNQIVFSVEEQRAIWIKNISKEQSHRKDKSYVGMGLSISEVSAVSVASDGSRAFCGSYNGTLHIIDMKTQSQIDTLTAHTGPVLSVAVTPDGRRAISGSYDKTICLWNLESCKLMATLEGHTGGVSGVAITEDGRRAISSSFDGTLRVWDLIEGKILSTRKAHTREIIAMAMTPDGQMVISSSFDHTVRTWELPSVIFSPETAEATVRYCNAKVLLVGESGVGKTALSIRLVSEKFDADTISTDGINIRRTDWATQLKIPMSAGLTESECEIWLWDFAGQADYRLIHQLFLDETSLVVLVFNPQSEDPFDGLGQWDHALGRAARRPFKKLLIAGRCDRGGLMISRESLENFRQERHFVEYIETSARTGKGCDILRDAIIHNIQWDEIPWTVSPRIFRLLKNEIIKLKDEGKTLLRITELKQHLELRLIEESFTLEQLQAVIGLLSSSGVVWQLEFGDFVLLQPELVNSYAAAVIRSVRSHTEEIGCIPEEDVFAGKLDFQDIKRLIFEEEQIVLRAMCQTFVNHGLCLREHTESGTLLIFPSYFKRERPELGQHPSILVTYEFSGSLDEIYATLIVRLHYSPLFLQRDRLWRFAADFLTTGEKRLGLKMTKKAEGTASLDIYFDPDVPDDVRVTFIRYIDEHLAKKAQNVVRLRYYICPHCRTLVESKKIVAERLKQGLKDIICVNCEKRVPLWDLIEEWFRSDRINRRVNLFEVQTRALIDNEARELAAEAHIMSIVAEAGQIWRRTPEPDWGIDGEIEFKDDGGKASGKRLYVQLKSGDSHLSTRKKDGAQIFTIKKGRYAEYWKQQEYPVMLVIRTSDGIIRWMDVRDHLERLEKDSDKKIRKIEFIGEPLNTANLLKLRTKYVGPPSISN